MCLTRLYVWSTKVTLTPLSITNGSDNTVLYNIYTTQGKYYSPSNK